MKQKIVIRVSITSEKCHSKAMGLVASTRGVESVAIQGYGRDELAVVGNDVDAAELTILLRTKMGNAKLLSVEAVASPKVKSPPSPPPMPTPTTPSPMMPTTTTTPPETSNAFALLARISSILGTGSAVYSHPADNHCFHIHVYVISDDGSVAM